MNAAQNGAAPRHFASSARFSSFFRFISLFVPLNEEGDVSSCTAGIRDLWGVPEAVVGDELVARVEPGPITSAATSAPTSAATAVINQLSQLALMRERKSRVRRRRLVGFQSEPVN